MKADEKNPNSNYEVMDRIKTKDYSPISLASEPHVEKK